MKLMGDKCPYCYGTVESHWCATEPRQCPSGWFYCPTCGAVGPPKNFVLITHGEKARS